MKDPKRYDNIPLSKTTYEGMSLNIDDLKGIASVLKLQDEVYDDEFEKLNKRLDATQDWQINVEVLINKMDIRITNLEEKDMINRQEISTIAESLNEENIRLEKIEAAVRVLQPDVIDKALKDIQVFDDVAQRLLKVQNWWRKAFWWFMIGIGTTIILMIYHIIKNGQLTT